MRKIVLTVVHLSVVVMRLMVPLNCSAETKKSDAEIPMKKLVNVINMTGGRLDGHLIFPDPRHFFLNCYGLEDFRASCDLIIMDKGNHTMDTITCHINAWDIIGKDPYRITDEMFNSNGVNPNNKNTLRWKVFDYIWELRKFLFKHFPRYFYSYRIIVS